MGPVDLITSRNSRTDAIRGEKGGARFEASMPYPIRVPRSAPLRALPQISHPTESANGRSVWQTRDFRNRRSPKDHSTKEKNGSSRLKNGCSLSTKRFFGSKQRMTSMQKPVGNSINSFLTQASIHSGANDGVMYLG